MRGGPNEAVFSGADMREDRIEMAPLQTYRIPDEYKSLTNEV